MRLATAANVQFGRALRKTKRTKASAKFLILPSPALRRQASQIGKTAACQLFWIAFTSMPFFAEIPLERAATFIGRINVIVHR